MANINEEYLSSLSLYDIDMLIKEYEKRLKYVYMADSYLMINVIINMLKLARKKKISKMIEILFGDYNQNNIRNF